MLKTALQSQNSASTPLLFTEITRVCSGFRFIAFAIFIIIACRDCDGHQKSDYTQVSVSRSGQYKCEYAWGHAEDPQSKEKVFCVSFEVRDLYTGLPVWRKENTWLLNHAPDSWRASCVYVSDYGTVVYFTTSGGVVVLRPDGERSLYSHAISTAIFGDDVSRGLHSVSMDPLALVFFEGQRDSERFFCRNLRNSICLNVATGQINSQVNPFPEETTELERRLLELKLLHSENAENKTTWPDEFDATIYWSGAIKVPEGVTRLGEICDLYFDTRNHEIDRASKSLDIFEPTQSRKQILLVFALLRSGGLPRRTSVVPIRISKEEFEHACVDPQNRDAKSRVMSPGDSRAKLVESMGCPDFAWQDIWAYDLSPSRNSTVFFQLSSGKIQSKYEISPRLVESEFAIQAVYSMQSLARFFVEEIDKPKRRDKNDTVGASKAEKVSDTNGT